ncbi:MAG: CRISPR-associated protein Cas4 [Syntrophobacteraceae bacterium]
MFAEADLLPLSALQHLLFCPRQCALIHLEGIWFENLFTVEGHILHERVHAPGRERRKTVRTEFALPLRSLRLGLSGKADAVEFHSGGGSKGERETPYPVEYKRGKPKADETDLVQLCAQALCLEEMLGVGVPEGAFFYERERRRTRVAFTEALRAGTEEAAGRLHELIASGKTPAPEYGKKCRSCSLMDACLPRPCGARSSVTRYMASVMEES